MYARQLVEGEGGGVAALWCRNKDGPKALVVDTNTLLTQTFPMHGEELAIRGHELIGFGTRASTYARSKPALRQSAGHATLDRPRQLVGRRNLGDHAAGGNGLAALATSATP